MLSGGVGQVVWAVIYVRPGPGADLRRAECVADAVEQGLGIRETTGDPAEAYELYLQGCHLIAPRGHGRDVFPRVRLVPRQRRARRAAAAVLLPLVGAWEWATREPGRAAGALASMVGVLLLGAPEPRSDVAPEPPQRPPVAAPPVIPSPRPSPEQVSPGPTAEPAPPAAEPPAPAPPPGSSAAPSRPPAATAPAAVDSPPPLPVEPSPSPAPTPDPSPEPATTAGTEVCLGVDLLGRELLWLCVQSALTERGIEAEAIVRSGDEFESIH